MDTKKLKLPKNVTITHASEVKRGRPLKDRTNEPKRVQLAVKVRQDLWMDIKKVADLREVSATSIIEGLISDYIKKYERQLKEMEKIKTSIKNKK